jgi:hypothetical protein
MATMIVLVCPTSKATKNALLKNHDGIAGIESTLTRILQKLSHMNLSPANVCRDSTIRNVYTKEIVRRSEATESILEIDPQYWLKIQRDYEMRRILSYYHPESGKIVLKGGCNWCLCNVIHEILHSRSRFSRHPSPPWNAEFIVEGITELLTGWILMHEYPLCYKNWREIERSCFLKPYLPYVKLWLYLCTHRLAVPKIMGLYLDNTAPDPFQTLADLLCAEGLQGCGSVISNRNQVDIDQFGDELYEAFGSDFAEFRAANIRILDLDKCLS